MMRTNEMRGEEVRGGSFKILPIQILTDRLRGRSLTAVRFNQEMDPYLACKDQ